MSLESLPLFNAMKTRLRWLTQRQAVLSQNIANADTPKYRARDLKPVDFDNLVKRSVRPLRMDVTDGEHLAGRKKSAGDFVEGKEKKPYETAPAGNSVVLEEQMGKINETAITHRIMTDLYKKHVAMIKMAIGKA